MEILYKSNLDKSSPYPQNYYQKPEEGLCVWCKKEVETDSHIIINCQKNQEAMEKNGF